MQTRPTGVREHIQNVEFLLLFVLNYAVGAIVNPALLPFLLNVSEIVFHYRIVIISSKRMDAKLRYLIEFQE